MRRTVFPAGLLAGLVALSGCSGPSGPAPPPDAPASASSPEPSSTQSARDRSPRTRPSAAALPQGAPPLVAIPAVRSFDPASGQGWWPRGGTRIITEGEGRKGPADEARLLAGELPGRAAPGPAGEEAEPGDVVLRIDQDRPREGYRLDTRDGALTITGGSDTGVFYGTRTALQTLRARGHVPSGVAVDRPDRPQRGLMVDIARKHYSKGWIEDRVREMGDLKLNQLHLHISDDQGFRVESESHPEIVSERHLTKRDIREIIALARTRHITVFPEIDSPGHLGAVLRAHPGLRLFDAAGRAAPGAVDISNPRAAAIVDDLYREFAELFPGRYWHLGGDEYRALAVKDPERSFPQLAAYARERYGAGATVTDAATGWLNDRAATVREYGKTVKAWNDGHVTGRRVAPDKDREVEYWTGKEYGQREPAAFLRDGRRLVNLNDEYLYYVLGEPNTFRYPTGERIYDEWTPAVLRGTVPVPPALAGASRVLGARLAVWGDLPGAQTEAQVAAGIRMPLRALAQKVWRDHDPDLSWDTFTRLADRVR